jgi:fluoride ion exporter CrcB/FEX
MDTFQKFTVVLCILFGFLISTASVVLCYKNNSHWGWFLFVGFCVVMSALSTVANSIISGGKKDEK